MCILLALTLANRVSGLHGISFYVQHSQEWNSCTFSFVPDFVAKTQNSLIHDPRFEVFTILSLDNFMDGDRDEFLLCPIRAHLS